LGKDICNLKVGPETTKTTMLVTQREKWMLKAKIGKKIALITSSLTSLMQSTDTQISTHPLCGLGWIPNKNNNTKSHKDQLET